jgi:hypothetical protein
MQLVLGSGSFIWFWILNRSLRKLSSDIDVVGFECLTRSMGIFLLLSVL